MITPNHIIFADIAAERERQIVLWGSDADMTPYDYHEMISDYSAWARRKAIQGKSYEARERYIQVAAIAVAAIQSLCSQVE